MIATEVIVRFDWISRSGLLLNATAMSRHRSSDRSIVCNFFVKASARISDLLRFLLRHVSIRLGSKA